MTTSQQKTTLTNYTTQQALDMFLLDAQARQLSPYTTKFYRRHAGAFVDFLAKQEVPTAAAAG